MLGLYQELNSKGGGGGRGYIFIDVTGFEIKVPY